MNFIESSDIVNSSRVYVTRNFNVINCYTMRYRFTMLLSLCKFKLYWNIYSIIYMHQAGLTS